MNKIILSIVLLSSLLFASVSNAATTYKAPTKLIKVSYIVVSTHKDYVTVLSNVHPNETLDFYYDDQQHKSIVHVNDQINAYFTKDNKGNFHLVDWHKGSIHYDTDKFTVTKVLSYGFYASNSHQSNAFFSNSYLKGAKVKPGNKVTVYYPHVADGMSEVSFIIKQ